MIDDLLRQALEDATVAEHTAVLLLVPGAPPGDAAEFAYLAPSESGIARVHRVLHDAEPELSTQPYSNCHCFAAYAEDTLPAGGLPVGLRHEAEHAAIFDRHGPRFFELESIVRLAMKRAGRETEYAEIPSERQANQAARAFAVANYPETIAELAGDERTQQFVAEVDPVADLVAEMAEMVWRYSRPDEIDEQDDDQRTLGVVVEELAREARGWHRIDPRQWRSRPDEVPLLVRLER